MRLIGDPYIGITEGQILLLFSTSQVREIITYSTALCVESCSVPQPESSSVNILTTAFVLYPHAFRLVVPYSYYELY